MKITPRSTLPLLLVLLSPTLVAQTLRYDARGFEGPTFHPGPLAGATMYDGQDGWLVTDDGTEVIDRSLIQVQTAVVYGGGQAVEIRCDQQPAPYGHLRRNAPFSVPPGEPVVEIRMEMMIQSSAQATDAWGLQAQNAPGPLGPLFIWDVFPDDHVYMFDDSIGNFVDTGFVLTRDAWHLAQTAIDYQNRVVSLTIDGQPVGTVPGLIGIDYPDYVFASIYFGIPGDDRMFVDDFQVFTRAQGSNGWVEPYCQSTPNSTGSAARIGAAGLTSITADDLVLSAGPVPTQPGVFFFGANQIELPFGNGYRCAGGQVVRFPVTVPPADEAVLSLDYANLPGGAWIAPGDVLHFQYWYRDPGVGMGFNTSDALRITFLP